MNNPSDTSRQDIYSLVPFFHEPLPKNTVAPRKQKTVQRTIPEGALRIEENSNEHKALIAIFGGVKARVDSILDRLYVDSDGHFFILGKKKKGGKLEMEKIWNRYHP